jgi:hypothetical protein
MVTVGRLHCLHPRGGEFAGLAVETGPRQRCRVLVREQLARDHLSVKQPRLGMDGIQIPYKRAMLAANRFKARSPT